MGHKTETGVGNKAETRHPRANIARYFHFYNVERVHESLGYRTPHEVYFGENRTFNGQTGELIHLKEPQLLS